MQAFRVLVQLGLTAATAYWIWQAWVKFAGVPVSSKLSYRYGDDGDGNIAFPPVAVCASPFAQIDVGDVCPDATPVFFSEMFVYTMCFRNASHMNGTESAVGGDSDIFGGLFAEPT